MTKIEMKEKIKEHEYNVANAGGMLCDYQVKVVNLQDDGDGGATADIIVIDNNGDGEQRFNYCEYPLEFFHGKIQAGYIRGLT